VDAGVAEKENGLEDGGGGEDKVADGGAFFALVFIKAGVFWGVSVSGNRFLSVPCRRNGAFMGRLGTWTYPAVSRAAQPQA
jgi:hypothetical protein